MFDRLSAVLCFAWRGEGDVAAFREPEGGTVRKFGFALAKLRKRLFLDVPV